jgi:Arc/MetJ-type ribon-helix-helix transcriptional regulator
MSNRKERVTVTLDPNLVKAGNDAVASGSADSLSHWVNTALTDRVEKDRKLRALGEAIAAYEVEFGEITDEEMEAQQRADRESAIVVRGRAKNGAASDRRRSA